MLSRARDESSEAANGGQRRWGDRGYAAALTALLILPLLGFTGLAVDLGGWYARAAAIQRTTDAAALAGVAALPTSFDAAEQAALEVARQNGFDDDDDDIDVSVSRVGDDRVRVEITDQDVPQYLTAPFRDDPVSVTRASVAEYLPPVRMGSPRNFLGTHFLDDADYGDRPEGFKLAASSPCSPGEDGDLLMPRYSGLFGSSGGFTNCSEFSPPGHAQTNDDRLADGYIYGVTVDEDYDGAPVAIEVYDPSYCNAWGSYDLRAGDNQFNTVFTVREPHQDPYQGTVLATETFGAACSGPTVEQWHHLYTISDPTPGEIYAIQVFTENPSNTTTRGSSNSFGLRAVRGGSGASFQPCSADEHELPDSGLTESDTGISPDDCPNVFALNNLSIHANADGDEIDGYINAQFFLASVGQEHSGKQLEIDLFDPGEGAHDLQVIDPNNQPHHESDVVAAGGHLGWSVEPRYAGEVAPAGGWSGTSFPIDVSGDGLPQPGPNRSHTYRYNDRQLRVSLDLPDNIEDAYGGRTWWSILYRFDPAADINDRTTWSITVRGDPVRLIE